MACDIYDERTKEYEEEHNLYGIHGYSIMQAKEINNQCLLQIKNPHGAPTWNGKWSTSDYWPTEFLSQTFLNKRIIKKDHRNGLFWMDYEDFKKHFQRVTISIDDAKLRERRIIGLSSNKCFYFTVEKKDFFYIRAYCDISRNLPNDSDLSVVLSRKKTNNRDYHNLSELDFDIVKKDHLENYHLCGFHFLLDPGLYYISTITLKSLNEIRIKPNAYNLIVHSKQFFQLNETKDLSHDIIFKMLCYANSCIELERILGRIPVIKSTLVFKGFRRFKLFDGNFAYILTTNLADDALIISVHNSSQKRCVKFKLNIKPRIYKCIAYSKKNPRKSETFEIVEKLTIYKVQNNSGNLHENGPLALVNERYLAIEHTIRPIIHTKIIAVVHRFIEEPSSVFEKHCAERFIDINEYEPFKSKNFLKRKFNIELENEEQISDNPYWNMNK